jgi:diguanylate cyclase (GGDEF)-like protein
VHTIRSQRYGEPPRSGRHRKSSFGRASAALSDWFTQPFDYDWIVLHHSTRHLRGLLGGVIAAGTLSIAFISTVMLFSFHGPTSESGRTWIVVMLGIQVAVAGAWLVLPLPNGRKRLVQVFVMFAIFGDVGLTSVLAFYDDFGRLTGCVLFSVTGAFVGYLMSPRWLAAHLAWSSFFTVVFGYLAFRGENEDPATILATTCTVLVATNGTPVFAQVAWTLISRDARNSTLDPLTGVFNRRGADNALLDLWAEAEEKRLSLVVLVVDIDKFKRVNDYHGHARGDEVIQLVSSRLAAMAGRRGVVARTGGEEFLVASTGAECDLHELIHLVKTGLYHPADPVPVTASIGAAVLPVSSVSPGIGASTIVRMARTADAHMYRAKESGGNDVSMTVL